jgi:chromosomal replication initiator protein
MSHCEVWKRASARLRVDLGEEVYASWFASLELDDLEAGLARVSTPTRFIKGWIEAHYADRILDALKRETGSVVRAQFVVRALARPVRALAQDKHVADTFALTERSGVGDCAAPFGAEFASHASARPALAVEDHATTGSPLDRRLTFDAFLVGPSNQLAYSLARRIAGPTVKLEPSPGPVYLHAAAGLGKTHLLQAAAQAAFAEGQNVVYLTAERFVRNFVAAVQARGVGAFQTGLRGVDLLILDNAQSLQGPAAQREFDDTLNALVGAGRRVIVAADRPLEELENLCDMTRARFAEGLCVRIGPLDESLCLRILEARVAAARLSHPSFALSPAVIQFLAQTIGANGRDIEGAIARLLVSAKLSGVPHTVESAQSAIRDLLQAHNPRRVTVEDIQNLVATHYSMTRADLLSAQKTAKVVKPRQVAMYLAKALTPRSLPEIGRRFGGRDHTTVLHAVRKIERLAGADRALSEEIELLKRGLARIGLVSSSFLKLRAMSKSHAQAC